MDRQSGITRTGGDVGADVPSVAATNVYGEYGRTAFTKVRDEGGASRYFPTFKYQAKAPASERPKIDGKGWPTVKPVQLMRWLVRLVTPPGGVVLDPFAGTGSTLQAAQLEGFRSLGIERDEFAYRLACVRLGLAGGDLAEVHGDVLGGTDLHDDRPSGVLHALTRKSADRPGQERVADLDADRLLDLEAHNEIVA
jgi:hypothetical protein